MLTSGKVHGTRLELVRLSTVEPKDTRCVRRDASLRDRLAIWAGRLPWFGAGPTWAPPSIGVLAIAARHRIHRSIVANRGSFAIAAHAHEVPVPDSEMDIMAPLRRVVPS